MTLQDLINAYGNPEYTFKIDQDFVFFNFYAFENDGNIPNEVIQEITKATHSYAYVLEEDSGMRNWLFFSFDDSDSYIIHIGYWGNSPN